MKILRLGASTTEAVFNDGTRVLYSYETPVAAFVPRFFEELPGGFVKTDKYFSRTTSGHITKWLGGTKAREISHSKIVALTEGR